MQFRSIRACNLEMSSFSNEYFVRVTLHVPTRRNVAHRHDKLFVLWYNVFVFGYSVKRKITVLPWVCGDQRLSRLAPGDQQHGQLVLLIQVR
ncbi:MAG: hypothetical protein LBR89_01460 [Holosporales bacterium]|nr:hypothetical protein [Holosporales bacterium]